MGSCTAAATGVEVTFKNNTTRFSVANIIELRLQSIKFFSINKSFLIISGDRIIKSSSDLFCTEKVKKIIKLTIELCPEIAKPHKSQIKIKNRLAVLYLSKYCIFPSELFNESNISKTKIYIGNEIYELKQYYQHLDLPGLTLGKLKTEKRKLDCLEISEETSDLSSKLYVYNRNKRYQADCLVSSRSMVASLAYDQKNSPVAIFGWNEKNLIIPISKLKASVHIAINLANLPNESLTLNISASNLSVINPIFTEYACFYHENSIYTYQPNEFSVSSYSFERKLENYSITQTPVGFIIHEGREIWNFSVNSLRNLPGSLSEYTKHSGLLHQYSYIAIGGSLTSNVESLNLSTFEWSSLPPLPCTIESPASCSIAELIYVIGGLCNNQPLDCVWRLGVNWELVTWKLPWKTSGAGVFAIGKEMIIFGGEQNDKDRFVVIDNGKKISSGSLRCHATFQGIQCGRVNFEIVIYSNQGRILRYDNIFKRFFICSIGNYFIGNKN